MSQKAVEDKAKAGFPFTARQKRRLKGIRESRKQDRHKGLKRQKKSAPKKQGK